MPWKQGFRVPILAALLAAALVLPAAHDSGSAWAGETIGKTAGDAGPAETIERFHAALLQAMRGGEAMGYEGRYQLLYPVIHEIFANRFMARFAAGRFWRDMGDEQRREYLRAYLDWTVSTYAERFDSYNGQRFRTVSEEIEDSQATVVTSMTRADQSPVEFTYRMRAQDGGWLVVDIIVRDVSQLAMARSQFTSILNREGFEALLGQLRQKMQVYSEDLGS